MKIKRKVHNKLFPTRKLSFYQHSKVDEWNSLECYMDKWLLVILFIPIVVIGTLVAGFPTATVSEPVEVMVYYVNFNTNRRFWMLKINVGWIEEHYKFPCKPTKRQIRKKKKEWIQEARYWIEAYSEIQGG